MTMTLNTYLDEPSHEYTQQNFPSTRLDDRSPPVSAHVTRMVTRPGYPTTCVDTICYSLSHVSHLLSDHSALDKSHDEFQDKSLRISMPPSQFRARSFSSVEKVF
jgi:hypothetical protein